MGYEIVEEWGKMGSKSRLMVSYSRERYDEVRSGIVG